MKCLYSNQNSMKLLVNIILYKTYAALDKKDGTFPIGRSHSLTFQTEKKIF